MSPSTRCSRSRDPFQSARQSFARWRNARAPGERIPDSLWQAAVEAAREHGVSKAAVALGLNHTQLKVRLKSSGRNDRREAFVPVTLPPLAVGPACIVEVEDGEGARLRVELSGPLASQAELIVRSLWKARA